MSAIDKLRKARIPPYVASRTLESLGQPVLRSALLDQVFLSSGDPLSLVISECELGTTQQARCATVFTRFAADLLVGARQKVYYAHAVTILGELARLTYVAETAPMNAVLEQRGKGYIAVPDLYNAHLTAREIATVCDFLIDHVTMGGTLLIGKFGTSGALAQDATPEFEAMLQSFQQFRVSE